MVNIKATYENIPKGSMQNSTTSGNYAQDFVDWTDFKTQRTVPKYATLEPNRNWLDGSFSNFPDDPSGLGYMSTIISDSNGEFANPIVITQTFTQNYTSPGLQIEFDSNTDDYAKNLNVKWYSGNTLVENQDYVVDSSIYFCNTPVSSFDKIVITITSMSKPYRFLKIFNISNGIVREFYNEEIESLEIIEQIDPSNQTLPINQVKTKIFPLSTEGVYFKRTLPFKIYRDDELYCHSFIKTSKSNTDKTIYDVTSEDYITLLNNQPHLGGIYTRTNAQDLISDILGDIPFELDTSLQSKTLSGYLPIDTKRGALLKVALALNAFIDTSRHDKIIIKSIPTIVSSTIDKSKIISMETNEENIITKYQIIQKKYTAKRILEWYEEEIFSGNISENILLTFEKPFRSLFIEGGTIVEQNPNYAIINGSGSVLLTGESYKEESIITTITNPYVSNLDIENVKETAITLFCDNEDIINNFKFIEYKIKSKFLMQNERVGDLVNLNGQICRITSLSYDLAQTNIYADAELEAYYG